MLSAFLAAMLVAGPGGATPPALSIRPVDPGRQWSALLDLFRGARAAHPAAALALWKRADPARSLGKGPEALIVLFNPEMARELACLDGAEVVLGLDPADGSVGWRAALPGDDGTVAAVATAMVLTDGAPEAPLGEASVDRLGPPGAPLLATRPGGGVALADTRANLLAALETRPSDGPTSPASGWYFRLDPSSLPEDVGPIPRRRLVAAARSLAPAGLEGMARVEGDALRVAWTTRTAGPSPMPDPGPLDPRWLALAPRGRTAAAWALALGPRGELADALLAAADRVERADPARAGVAPLRPRLALLALPIGANLEADFWPRLRGVSGCLLTDPDGRPDGLILALHAEAPESAARIADRLLPRLARPWLDPGAAAAPGGVGPIRPLGRSAGRPVELARDGSSVLVGWGEGSLAAALGALADPSRSEGPALASGWGDADAPRRAGAIWPARLRGLAGTPGLADAPPATWSGRPGPDGTWHDAATWPGLDRVIARWLDTLPLAPSP